MPKSLEILDCSWNFITSLNNLPEGLKELYCSNNQIISLKNLPKALEKLFCEKNKSLLKNLNLPDSIKEYKIGNSNIL